MSKITRATQALEKASVAFTLHTYAYDPGADSIGLQAAAGLGAELCAIVPSDREVSMKKLAAAFQGKSAKMMRPADAERLTGYHVGGISPFGQKKRVPSAIEQSALAERSVFINGGQRGLQIEIEPNDALKALDAIAAALAA
jgi:Cys-tRNA(Pro)/Cys-tRNA(Cys) deacylase